MWNFFRKNTIKNETPHKDFQVLVKKELEDNEEVIQSLRDYDAGKKEISTADIRRNLQSIRSAS